MLAILLASALPAHAQAPRTVEPGRLAVPEATATFVIGNLEFVLLHELAHMLIADLDIPVIGPEENAADYIATAVLLTADPLNRVRAERARQFLLATANGLATSWEVDAETGREIRFWDAHNLTIQRFYQIICLVYGNDPVQFARLPERVGMPAERAARCPAEYARAEKSLMWMIEHYGRQPGDPPGAPVDLVFDNPPTRTSAAMLSEIRASGLLDNTVRRLNETFTIAEPFRIAIRRCRKRQAAWIPEDRELRLCYELIDNYYLLAGERRTGARQSLLGE